jgi:hypothetical protein
LILYFSSYYSSNQTIKSQKIKQEKQNSSSIESKSHTAASKLTSLSFHHSKTDHLLTNKTLHKTKSQRYSNENKLSQKPPKYSTNNLLYKSDSNIYSPEEGENSIEMQKQHNYLDIINTVPRSTSDLNIVKILNKNFKYSRNLSSHDPEENNTSILNTNHEQMNTSVRTTIVNNKTVNSSKSPSLNSILDTQTEILENNRKQKEDAQNSPKSSYQNGVVTRNIKNSVNNKVHRGSDYTTDSGIGQCSLIDTYSHRSSIISQGSIDSGTQSNTSSNLNNNNSVAILNCSNYMRDLSNNNNSEFIKKNLLLKLLNKLHKSNSFVFIKLEREREKEGDLRTTTNIIVRII